MITNRNILCISTPPFEGIYASTTVQLMQELSKHNRVLFVNNPFTLKDVTDGLRGKKNVPVKKVFGIKNRLKTIVPGNTQQLYVLTPPMVLSTNFLPKGTAHKLLMQLNGWLYKTIVKRYLKKLGMQHNLINIVSFNPALGLEAGRQFGEKTLLYLCYDEIESAPHLKKHGGWQEKEFAKKADAVVVTSQGLYERKKHLSKKCFLVKNAANYSLFSQGFNPVINTKKTIGFIGGVDSRLNYPLLEFIINSLPHVRFEFIGRILNVKGESILRKYKNVVLMGPKQLHELPSYVKHFSAGIIPFKLNENNKSVYPLKINEYLAAGIPVVTTNFSHLEEFVPIVKIAKSDEEFKNYLVDEMVNDSIEKKQARQAMAKQNSWEHRAEELSAVITELESSKKETAIHQRV